MSYQIITDSCCDFTDREYEALRVTAVPLSVMWDGENHSHFSDEKALKDFYERMRQGLVATTSALNPADWAGAMEPWLRGGKDLLVMAVSSGISATYQSAVIAAEDLRERYPDRVIRVVDTRSGSLGEGLLVWYACKMRDAGESLHTVAEWVKKHCTRLCHWVTVDNLAHLKRSGRLSSTSAMVGTMLNIKPIIRVTEEGKLVAAGVARGRKASIRALAKKFAEARCHDEEVVAIAHGDCAGEAELLKKLLKEEYGVKHVLVGFVGPILGAHTGPGVMGLFHLGLQR
ncbi:MAG: DegV family protein [Oscillospiraceae bacterium]|nr:DegV family protein [Oscillospiraceae bacterium]